MKNLKTRILSAILSATVLTSALPFMAGAQTAAVEYDATLFSQDFNAGDLDGMTFKDSKTVPLTISNVSASDEAIADAESHGNVAKIYKGAESATKDDGSVNEGLDSYFRINYETDADPIDDKFLSAPEALRQVKASFDIMIPTENCGLNVRFYKRFSQGTEGTVADNLAVMGSGGNISFLNSSKTLPWENGKWYTLEFILDFETGTYSASVNGEQCVENIPFTNLKDCITAFGITNSKTTSEYTIYVDNFDFSVPKTNLIPEDTNTVWENDFEAVEATDGVLPSGTESGSGINDASIDMRVEKCNWEIKEENGNKYFYFAPYDSSKIANVGNRIDGYFATSGQDTRNSGADSGVNTVDVSPYPIDVNPIDLFRLDMSVKLDSAFNTGIKIYYRNTYKANYSTPLDMFIFYSDGSIKLGAKTKLSKTYTPGEWIDITLWQDYQKNVVTCFIDGEFAGIAPFQEIPFFNQMRIRTSPSENSGVDIASLGMSIDNIRYSTTRNQDYIDRKPYSGYETDIASFDFEDLAPNTTLFRVDSAEGTGVQGAKVVDPDGTTVESKKYYVQSTSTDPAPVTIVYDGDRESNVALVNVKNNRLGTGRAYSRDFNTFEKYGKYPDIVKAEVEMMKTSGDAYIYMNNINAELFVWFSSNQIAFDNGTARTSSNSKNPVITKENGEWIKVTMYFDFASGKYTAFLDDELIGRYTIPSLVTSPEMLCVSSNTAGALYVDSIKLTTVEPYSGSVIGEYMDTKNETHLGYVLNNADTENEYNYGVYCAKYSADGSLENITIAEEAVAAGTMELKNLEKLEAADGGYYTYFIWENLTSLKPLFESKTIK
ncbi:MAG: hypothetical protein IJ460_01900 [Clostridia bacterium]|nr:hypothetical protein [Clostridia bacterium]